MRKILICILLSIFVSNFAQNLQRIKVAQNGHYLQLEDGTPFFWLGDTGWELFHRLTLDEINFYLDNRKQKGFNVIQAVVLAENDGLRIPNQYGEVPLNNLNPLDPNENYFRLIDTVIRLACSKGLYIGLLPTWGDKVSKFWGVGPEIFDSINAYEYGKWIGSRYKDDPNIIWILGGDRPAMTHDTDHRSVWRAMAKGIREGTLNKCIISYHPSGEANSSQWFHNDNWLDINMIQSGHGGGHDRPIWEWIKRDYNYFPPKPTLDAEPNYEDHPVKPWPKWNPENGYYRDYDVRKQCYRSVFAGGCGVTYGHHAIWQFMNAKVEAITYPDRGWINALDRPGAFQVGYLRKLIESRPFLNRVPDNSIILEGQSENPAEHMEAFRDVDFSYVMIYMPVGKLIRLNTKNLGKKIVAWWFNPRKGEITKIGVFTNNSIMEFTPPTVGYQNDWVLIIDNASKNYTFDKMCEDKKL